MEHDGSLMQMIRAADPVLLYRLADVAEDQRREMHEIRRCQRKIDERLDALEQHVREEAAEERGRRAAAEQYRPPMTRMEMFDLVIKAGGAALSMGAAAWVLIEVVIRSTE